VKESVERREPSREIVDQAIEWIRAAGDRRFFLFLHTYDVHSDYRSRPEYEREFVRPYDGAADGSTAQLIGQRAGKVVLERGDMGHLVDLYDAGIRQMDDEIGRLLTALGDARDTLVLLTSDHGEEFLEHGGVLHGRTQYEEVVRVPLIVRGPGVPRGVRVATTASLVDVMPTILAAAAAPPVAGVDGADLAPTWAGGGAALGERHLSCEADHNNVEPDMTRAVRHRKDKLHWNRVTGALQLFDLGADPGELVDTAARRPEAVAALRVELDRFRAARGAGGGDSVTLTPEQVERLKSLGYLR
jgi:arylsulfatase A-like enzyme